MFHISKQKNCRHIQISIVLIVCTASFSFAQDTLPEKEITSRCNLLKQQADWQNYADFTSKLNNHINNNGTITEEQIILLTQLSQYYRDHNLIMTIDNYTAKRNLIKTSNCDKHHSHEHK